MKKKTLMTIAIILVATLLVGGLGVWLYSRHYNNQNHADKLDDEALYEYNYILTAFGRNASVIADDEVLVLTKIDKQLGGNSVASFVIYKYTNESDLSAALHMTAEEIANNAAYEYMGTGTVTLVNDQFAGMQNMKTIYTK